MQTFKLETAELKTAKNGNPYIKATILGEGEISIFNEFPDFANLKAGSMVMGEIKVNGKYKNLVYASQTPKTGNGGAFKQKMIEDTMAKKNESISHFQATKEESIKLAGAQRDAVLITTARGVSELSEDEIKAEIIKWYNWLLNDLPKGEIPF